MSKILCAAFAASVLAAGGTASAMAVGPDRFSVTNDTARVVECTLLVDGATRTYLKVHPTKTYFTPIDPGRLVQLVCIRGKEGVYALKLGTDYRFVAAPSSRVDIQPAKGD